MFLFSLIISGYTKDDYLLMIGTYIQEPWIRPEVSGITIPFIHYIPKNDIDTCNGAGEKIINEIYKPIWQFDSRWTFVFRGDKNKVTF